MKEYYKYANGYINLNDENLYLTNSGNWQETLSLEEKKSKAKQPGILQRPDINIFKYSALGLFLVLMRFGPVGKYNILFGLPIAIYFLMWLFKKEQAKPYKIPLTKIEAIKPYNEGLKIIFRNGNNEPDFEIVDNVDPKGIETLIGLKPTTI